MLDRPDVELYLKYALIPIFASIIGWGTNVIALKMTFYPLEYIGYGETYFRKFGVGPWHLGWQGIVPSKAAKMAQKAITLLTSKLIDVKEIFSRIEPERVGMEVEPVIHKSLNNIISEVAMTYCPDTWTSLPTYVRDEVVVRVHEDMPMVMTAVMADIRENIEDILDLEHMVVSHLVADKELLVSVFMRAGRKELKFIENSGLYFGFILGIVQAFVFALTNHSWLVLPVAGFISGYVTNWIALEMIFKPVDPINICGNKVQGLFLSHQDEVSDEFGTAVAREIMTSEQILTQLFLSPTSDKAVQIIHFHISQAIDGYGLSLGPLLPLAVGGDTYSEVKQKITELYVRELPQQIKCMSPYFDQALRLEETLVNGLKAMPPRDFESVLHPIFQEDEWLLILVGGLLGFVVGVFQILVVFGKH
mmetsp:Transcript_5718/g.16680  ORF Transcript_5718/g.16680 Transcript_5718/m.16680 type:complete len:420 (+) Transcript_5718:94-1353(+)